MLQVTPSNGSQEQIYGSFEKIEKRTNSRDYKQIVPASHNACGSFLCICSAGVVALSILVLIPSIVMWVVGNAKGIAALELTGKILFSLSISTIFFTLSILCR